MKTVDEPILVDVDHTVDLDRRQGIKEELWFYFDTSWRGLDAGVKMSADRYTHSSGLSEWRIYAKDAFAGSKRERGDSLTDVARTRLGEAAKPLVVAWLKSVDYTVSEMGAYAFAIKRMAHDLRCYMDEPTRELRAMVDLYANKLRPTDCDRLIRMADAYDAFSRIYLEGSA